MLVFVTENRENFIIIAEMFIFLQEKEGFCDLFSCIKGFYDGRQFDSSCQAKLTAFRLIEFEFRFIEFEFRFIEFEFRFIEFKFR